MNAEHMIDFIRVALEKVDQPYYASQPHHDELLERFGIPPYQNQYNQLVSFLTRYGERVFCYEFYHQVRILVDHHYREHPEEAQEDRQACLYLQAELHKAQIRDLLELFANVEAQLDKEYIPDFLLHGIGHFRRQELIVEVKSNPQLPISDFKYDVGKLQEFITKYSYRYGLFLTVNTHPRKILQMLHFLRRSGWLDNIVSKDQIVVMCKPDQHAPLYEVRLDSIPDQ